jgi:glucose-6-phosphate-specific signal transduction histidine kinase
MQEILNNAIKHGAPTELSCVSDIDQHTLTITVTNQGGSALDHSRYTSPGHGLLNIRKRIAKFPAGAFELMPIATGARAVLSFSLVDRPAEPTHPPTSSHSVT